MALEDIYSPSPWPAFGAALAFHCFLLMWDPTILKASAYHMSTPVIRIEMLDHLPVVRAAQARCQAGAKENGEESEEKRIVHARKKPSGPGQPAQTVGEVQSDTQAVCLQNYRAKIRPQGDR